MILTINFRPLIISISTVNESLDCEFQFSVIECTSTVWKVTRII